MPALSDLFNPNPGVTPQPAPPPPPNQPPPVKQTFATRPVSQQEIEEYANSQFVPDDIEIVDNSEFSDELQALNQALQSKAGTFWNPNGTTMADFNFQFFFYKGQRYEFFTLQCFLESKATGKKMLSQVSLWPNGKFWAIRSELVNLAR